MNPLLQSGATKPTSGRQSTATEQLVSFRLDREEYAVEISRVREIVLLSPVTRLPHAPPYVQGLINLRNTVIPVVDLRRRFGLPEQEPTNETRIVVVNLRGKTVGLVVDAVCEVFRVAREQIVAPPPTVHGVARNLLRGLVQFDQRLVIVLELDALLEEGA